MAEVLAHALFAKLRPNPLFFFACYSLSLVVACGCAREITGQELSERLQAFRADQNTRSNAPIQQQTAQNAERAAQNQRKETRTESRTEIRERQTQERERQRERQQTRQDLRQERIQIQHTRSSASRSTTTTAAAIGTNVNILAE